MPLLPSPTPAAGTPRTSVDALLASDVRVTRSFRSARMTSVAAVVIVALLVGAIGTLGATTILTGAVATVGRLEVETKIKKVQHPGGGVVAEILARDGDRVAAGAVLVRLNETIARANLAIVSKAFVQHTARLARLTHERDGMETLVFPPDLESRRAADPEVESVLRGEERLFEARLAARNGQRSQLRERIQQSLGTIDGLIAQIAAKDKEIELIETELAGVNDLYARKLVQLSRVTQLQRDAARLKGERGALVSASSTEKGRIAEVELQVLSIDQQLRQEVSKEIRETQSQIAEVSERVIAAEDTLQRLEVRAPQAGLVNQSVVNTVGGVVQPGETLMYIVPEHDALVAEVQISPADIDQVFPGQQATLRLSAFDRTSTPEVNATLSYISADLSKDERTGATYYSAKISIPPAETDRLAGLKLLPGMPVEVFLKTTDRTILSYLTKPITDQTRRAFRES